jgi:hypothetical protein
MDVHEWIKNNQEEFQGLITIIAIVAGVLLIANSSILIVIAIIFALIFVIRKLIEYWPQISEAAGKAWDKLKTGASAFWGGFTELAQTAVNMIIQLINHLIIALFSGINNMIAALDKVKINVPAALQKLLNLPAVIGFNVGLLGPPPQIPLWMLNTHGAGGGIPAMATGGVIPPNAAFAAILGDQRTGKNIEAPEALIRQIIKEEIGNQGSREITINFAGSLGALIREMKPYIDRENVRIGNSLISGATG